MLQNLKVRSDELKHLFKYKLEYSNFQKKNKNSNFYFGYNFLFFHIMSHHYALRYGTPYGTANVVCRFLQHR